MTVVTEFIIAISATISDMYSHEMVFANALVMIKVGEKFTCALKMQPGGYTLGAIFILIPVRPEPAISVTFFNLTDAQFSILPELKFVP